MVDDLEDWIACVEGAGIFGPPAKDGPGCFRRL